MPDRPPEEDTEALDPHLHRATALQALWTAIAVYRIDRIPQIQGGVTHTGCGTRKIGGGVSHSLLKDKFIMHLLNCVPGIRSAPREGKARNF